MRNNVENNGDIIIYQSEDGITKINVNLQDETVWLSIDQMSDLFQRDKSTISRHIKNIFIEGELQYNSVVANYLQQLHQMEKPIKWITIILM